MTAAASCSAAATTTVDGIGAPAPQPTVVTCTSGFPSTVECAVLLSKDEGFVTVFSDRTVKVWTRRDLDKYWPSATYSIPSNGTCGVYSEQMRRLFVGMANGVIIELAVSDDCNRLTSGREYPSHTHAVAAIFFSITCELVLSTGKDNSFVWQCSETGKRLGSLNTGVLCSSIEFDSEAKYVFLGDSAGNVSVFRFRDMNCELVSRLRAHTDSVSSLSWDAARQLLFSASHDKLIIVWDIGSCKGTAFELMGHRTKITSLAYSPSKLKLFSADDSGCVVCWDMNIQRQETPEWKTSNICQCCGDPFFWNMKDMWNKKIVGLRQHHCRICGKAVCDRCSQNRIKYPPMGYELAVRICTGCFREYGSRTFKPLAKFVDAKHHITGIDFNDTEDYLLISGVNSVDIWNIKDWMRSDQ